MKFFFFKFCEFKNKFFNFLYLQFKKKNNLNSYFFKNRQTRKKKENFKSMPKNPKQQKKEKPIKKHQESNLQQENLEDKNNFSSFLRNACQFIVSHWIGKLFFAIIFYQIVMHLYSFNFTVYFILYSLRTHYIYSLLSPALLLYGVYVLSFGEKQNKSAYL